MGFHRLSTPVYSGGLRAGDDYINNAASGTPAPANGVLISGVNAGSYFVGFQDDATSANFNRPIKALAENCDLLDDAVVALQDSTATLSTTVTTLSGTVSSQGTTLAALEDYQVHERETLVTLTAFPHTLLANENLVCINSVSGGTINLPSPASCIGRKFFFYCAKDLTFGVGGGVTFDSNPSSTPGGPVFLNQAGGGTSGQGATTKAMAGFPRALYVWNDPDTQLQLFTPDGANWLVSAMKGNPW